MCSHSWTGSGRGAAPCHLASQGSALGQGAKLFSLDGSHVTLRVLLPTLNVRLVYFRATGRRWPGITLYKQSSIVNHWFLKHFLVCAVEAPNDIHLPSFRSSGVWVPMAQILCAVAAQSADAFAGGGVASVLLPLCSAMTSLAHVYLGSMVAIARRSLGFLALSMSL